MRKLFPFAVASILLFGSVLLDTASAQYKQRIPIFVRNNGADIDTLEFGTESGATYGIDHWLGEDEYPPFPPEEIFESRFVNIPGHSGDNSLGLGVKRDVRGWESREQVDTFRLRFQPGAPGYPVTISWGAVTTREADQLTIKAGDQTIDMMTANSLTITDDAVTSATIYKVGAPAQSGIDTSDYGAMHGFFVRQTTANPVRKGSGVVGVDYLVPSPLHVTVKLFNVLGQSLRTLVDADQSAGVKTLRIGTEDLEAGTYYYTVSAGAFTATRSIVVLD